MTKETGKRVINEKAYYYLSNATDTNYFTTFLQITDVALVIFK